MATMYKAILKDPGYRGFYDMMQDESITRLRRRIRKEWGIELRNHDYRAVLYDTRYLKVYISYEPNHKAFVQVTLPINQPPHDRIVRSDGTLGRWL